MHDFVCRIQNKLFSSNRQEIARQVSLGSWEKGQISKTYSYYVFILSVSEAFGYRCLHVVEFWSNPLPSPKEEQHKHGKYKH